MRDPSFQVNMLPTQTSDLAAAHAGFNRKGDDGRQRLAVDFSATEQFGFLARLKAPVTTIARLRPPHQADRVSQALHPPVTDRHGKDVRERPQVAVDGRRFDALRQSCITPRRNISTSERGQKSICYTAVPGQLTDAVAVRDSSALLRDDFPVITLQSFPQ